MDPENAIFAFAPLGYAIVGTALSAMLIVKKKRIAGFSFAVTGFASALYFLSSEHWDWSQSGFHRIAWLTLICSGGITIFQIRSHLTER